MTKAVKYRGCFHFDLPLVNVSTGRFLATVFAFVVELKCSGLTLSYSWTRTANANDPKHGASDSYILLDEGAKGRGFCLDTCCSRSLHGEKSWRRMGAAFVPAVGCTYPNFSGQGIIPVQHQPQNILCCSPPLSLSLRQFQEGEPSPFTTMYSCRHHTPRRQSIVSHRSLTSLK